MDLELLAGQVSITSTFYFQLFCMKVLCTVFLSLGLGFEFFWQNNIGAKASRFMSIKLTTV